MKQGIASVWLLALVIGFIFMFSAYITITLNYTASFKMKNEVLKIIEKKKGVTNYSGQVVSSIFSPAPSGTIKGKTGTIQTINVYLLGNAYSAMGYCPDPANETDSYESSDERWIGINKLDAETADWEWAVQGKKYYYCLTKLSYGKYKGKARYTDYKLVPYYYKVRMFYKFEIPALSDFFSVKVEGKTMEIIDTQDTIWESS